MQKNKEADLNVQRGLINAKNDLLPTKTPSEIQSTKKARYLYLLNRKETCRQHLNTELKVGWTISGKY